MIRHLKLKEDFEQSVQRFEAWWHGQVLDRPVITTWMAPARQPKWPSKHHANMRQRWLDVEYQVDAAIALLEASDYPLDSFPTWHPNVGPELTSTLFGCELEFSEHTSWSIPNVHCGEDWRRIAQAQPDFNNPYWRAIENMTALALEKCDGRFVPGIADLHGNFDILAGLREPQDVCMDLVDCPELVSAACANAARAYVQAFNRLYRPLREAGFGATTWCPFYHEGPAYIPSCDLWCMLSYDMARDLVLPHILTEMQPLDRSIFHLDGPQALRLLPLLLELPQLNAVQWVYGAGNGPASRWIDVYKRILAAGKCIQLIVEGPADALAVLEHTGLEGVWITGTFDSAPSAEAFAQDALRCRKTKVYVKPSATQAPVGKR